MSKKTQLQILYSDTHIIAINKPPRIACVPAEGIPLNKTILGKIQRQFKGKKITPYLLHRLDYQTSGVLLFGKYEHDRQVLREILKNPQTQKKYIALVKGVPQGKQINIKLEARTSGEKIPAQTNFKILRIFKQPAPLMSLVEAEIKTGRKHQIRKHFTAIGHPLIMDAKYGDSHLNRKFRMTYRLGRLFLHAQAIKFMHPFLEKEIVIEAPLPPDLKSVVKRLEYGRT